MMKTTLLFVLCSCLCFAASVSAFEDLAVLPQPARSSEASGALQGPGVLVGTQLLHAHLMDEVRAAVARRAAVYEAVQTPDQIRAYQERMRKFFVKQIGGLPERTPLNARVVGRQQRDGYRIEKIIFESQPKHYVTAILYLPTSQPPYPGVLVPCGHSANGKARDLYQRAPILMAKSGMAALCYDPIDQGERLQLLDEAGKPLITRSTEGHNRAGVGAILVGRNTATYRIWDGIRALDYLAERPEVDPQRLGCTGISGGGTMTSYLMALDDRVQVAAPGCYLTSFQRLLETIGPQDAEQTIYGQIGFGMDHADYVLMRASKPTLVMTATSDFFDIDGAWHSFRQAKRWYGRMGFAERVDLFEVDSAHGFPPEMRVAAARWMRRWLLKIDDAIVEHESPVASDADLQCTPRGAVMLLPGARSVYDLNVAVEQELAEQRKQLWQAPDRAAALAKVRAICGIRPLGELPLPVSEQCGSLTREGYRIDKIVLRPQTGVPIPALVFVPERPSGAATLYLHPAGKQAAAQPGGVIESLVRAGHTVMAPDVCGIGETKPASKHSYAGYLPPEWSTAMMAYLLGKPLLAMRSEDVLMCARHLAASSTKGALPVDLVGIGELGPVALHAAALETGLFGQVQLQQSLVSWASVVRTPLAKNPFTNLVHGALTVYDLPDLCTSLPAERLEIRQPVDATGEALGL